MFPFLEVSDWSPVQKIYDSSFPTEIKIRVEVARVAILSLHPNGLVSGKFIKAIVHDLAEAWTDTFNGDCYTVVEEDYSSNRELYWLWKGEGETYFEQEWELEYDCVSILSLPDQLAYRAMAAAAQDFPATLALRRDEFPNFEGYQPMEYTEDEAFMFDPKFIASLELYREGKGPMAFQDMTIRQVLREFMGTWRVQPVGIYTLPEITMLARNTFMYFFRNHPNFTALARRVLHGFDIDCIRLTGIISNKSSQADLIYDFTWRPTAGRHEARSAASRGTGSSSDPSNQGHEQHVGSAKHHVKFFHFFSFFTFSFFIIMIIMCGRLMSFCDIAHCESPHLDVYNEL